MKKHLFVTTAIAALLGGAAAFANPISTYPDASTPLSGNEASIGTQGAATVQITTGSISTLANSPGVRAALPAATIPLTGGETIGATQSGATVQITTSSIANVPTGLGTTAVMSNIADQAVRFGTSANHTADVYLSDTTAGSHTTVDHAPMVINSVPVGSGVNGPGAADLGMQISVVKNSYSTSTALGELDGLYTFVRNGYDDAGGFLTNVGVANGAGYILEGNSEQFNGNFSTVLQQWDVQLGAISTGYTGGAFAWGEVINGLVGGNLTGGLLIQTATGADMGNAIQVANNNNGNTTFTLTPGGVMTDNYTNSNITVPGIVLNSWGTYSVFGLSQAGNAEGALVVDSNGDLLVDARATVFIGYPSIGTNTVNFQNGKTTVDAAGDWTHTVGFSRPAMTVVGNLSAIDASPQAGDVLSVSDATSCTANGNVTGGGNVTCALVYSGASWKAMVTH